MAMKNTFTLEVITEGWPGHREEFHGFTTQKEAKKAGDKILANLMGDTLDQLLTSYAIHEIRHHSNPWRD